ncbi:acyltransferase [Limibacter armeniacum]|uniref:acyltransferase n=1 Tax=Limibacter armeniacum TaxID=466084 RepID=UPI002FE55537
MGKLNYIHNMRALAILLIVGVHVRDMLNWNEGDISEELLVTLFDNGTVVFVFIAGFLFQYLNSNKPFKFSDYLWKKFKFVLTPYLILSALLIPIRLWMQEDRFFLPPDFYEHNLVWQARYYLITGTHLVPLWFIPMVVLIYLCSPLLLWMDKTKYFYLLALLPICLSFMTFRPAWNTDPILAFFHFLPIYIIGMGASHFRKKLETIPTQTTFTLLSLWAILSIGQFTGLIPGHRYLWMEDIWQQGVWVFNIGHFRMALISVILVPLFSKFVNQPYRLSNLLANYSFGIFYLHFILVILLQKISVRILHINTYSISYFLVVFSMVMITSCMMVWTTKKLLKDKSRILIGS